MFGSGGEGGEWMRGWALPILWEQGGGGVQGSHRNLIMNFHDFSMTICRFSMTFDHQLKCFMTTPF